jgi:hypothetical protein
MVDTKLESENHEEIVSNNGRIVGVAEVDTKSEVSHGHQPYLENQVGWTLYGFAGCFHLRLCMYIGVITHLFCSKQCVPVKGDLPSDLST